MKEKLISALKEALQIEGRTIELTDTFRDYEEWDSLSRLSLIATLDEEFGIQVEDKDFELLITVEDLLKEIEKRSNS
jgi:acyl carrier protein